MSRLLGLDWGRQRIGVAISDDRCRFAVGYDVWPSDRSTFFQRLEKVAKEEDIGLLIIGYPLRSQGEIGSSAQEVDLLIAELEQRGYSVTRWDERFTSQTASRDLSKIGISQKKQRGRLDMSAAVLILQSYIDESLTQPPPHIEPESE